MKWDACGCSETRSRPRSLQNVNRSWGWGLTERSSGNEASAADAGENWGLIHREGAKSAKTIQQFVTRSHPQAEGFHQLCEIASHTRHVILLAHLQIALSSRSHS